MTDRELLELAAKAAGIYLAWQGDEFPIEVFERWNGNPNEPPDPDCRDWNPLTSDADALRLAVDLWFTVEVDYCDDVSRVLDADGGNVLVVESHYGTNKHAATRRAITRAAAAIGEQK